MRALEARVRDLFGDGVDWRGETGVLQVAAIGARPRVPIAIDEGAPASPTDRFVLGFARARADAIVTTGSILRAEPHLVHRTSDEPAEAAGWRRWRADVLGRHDDPRLLVLTRSGALPVAHPALRAASRPVVWTSEAGRARLVRQGVARELDVIAGSRESGLRRLGGERGSGSGRSGLGSQRSSDRAPGGPSESAAALELSAAIRWLRDELGAATISIEAGPAATLDLYAVGGNGASAASVGADREAALVRVDELLLGIYAGPSFPAVDAPPFPGTEALAAYFSPAEGEKGAGRVAQPRTRRRVDEASGPWLFERYRRIAGC